MLNPVGFWSYGRHDDEHSSGALSQLRKVVGDAISMQYGAKVKLFQDKEAITPGADWAAEIDRAISQTSFYLPIVTPRFLKSRNCHAEFRSFRRQMEALGYDDLIFPVHYVDVEEIAVEDTVFGEDLDLLFRPQWIDFRPLFYADPRSAEVRQWAGGLASSILKKVRLHRIAETQERARREQDVREAEEHRQQEDVERRQAEERARLAQAQAQCEAEQRKRREETERPEKKRRRQEAASQAAEDRKGWEAAVDDAAANAEPRSSRAMPRVSTVRNAASMHDATGPISEGQRAGADRSRLTVAMAIMGSSLAAAVALGFWFARRPNPIEAYDRPAPPSLRVPSEQVADVPFEKNDMKAAIESCDRLAASPFDRDRPVQVSGVTFEAMDENAAIQACRAAIKAVPNDRRIAYQLGRGLAAGKLFDQARIYYKTAADLGSVSAMVDLGTLYANGQGVKQDYASALSLYETAANAGNAVARYNLGYLYGQGDGVVKDCNTAFIWYAKSIIESEYPISNTKNISDICKSKLSFRYELR